MSKVRYLCITLFLTFTVATLFAIAQSDRQALQRKGGVDKQLPRWAEHVGTGSVLVSSEGEWVVQLDALGDAVSFKGAIENGDFPVDEFVNGTIHLVLDDKSLWIMILKEPVSIEGYEIEEITLTLADTDAKFIGDVVDSIPIVHARSDASATPFVPREDEDEGSISDHEWCAAGSCSCSGSAGSCEVCCPSGYIPMCLCSTPSCVCRPQKSN